MLVMLLILCLVLATRCYGVGDVPAIPSLAAWNRLVAAVKELQGRLGVRGGTLPRAGTSMYVKVTSAPVDGFATVQMAIGDPPDDFTTPTGYPEINNVYVGSAVEGDFIQIVPCNGVTARWSVLEAGSSFWGVVDSCLGSIVSVKKATGGSFGGTGGPTYSTGTIDCIAMTDYVRVGDQGLVVKFGGLEDVGYVFFPIVKFGLVEPPDDGEPIVDVSGPLAKYQDDSEPETCSDAP